MISRGDAWGGIDGDEIQWKVIHGDRPTMLKPTDSRLKVMVNIMTTAWSQNPVSRGT